MKRGDTLVPCTIHQLHYLAQQIQHEDGFMLDGKLLGYVSIIAQVLRRSDHEANITLEVDDGTGTIDV